MVTIDNFPYKVTVPPWTWVGDGLIKNGRRDWCLSEIGSEGGLWRIEPVGSTSYYNYSFASEDNAVLFALRFL